MFKVHPRYLKRVGRYTVGRTFGKLSFLEQIELVVTQGKRTRFRDVVYLGFIKELRKFLD